MRETNQLRKWSKENRGNGPSRRRKSVLSGGKQEQVRIPGKPQPLPQSIPERLEENNNSIPDDQPSCFTPYSHPGDPNEDGYHDWRELGEADGTTFYKCRKCGKEIEQ